MVVGVDALGYDLGLRVGTVLDLSQGDRTVRMKIGARFTNNKLGVLQVLLQLCTQVLTYINHIERVEILIPLLEELRLLNLWGSALRIHVCSLLLLHYSAW